MTCLTTGEPILCHYSFLMLVRPIAKVFKEVNPDFPQEANSIVAFKDSGWSLVKETTTEINRQYAVDKALETLSEDKEKESGREGDITAN